MAKVKKHIKNIEEFNQALRIVGGVFPHNTNELELVYKISNNDEVNDAASKYSFDDIWNASKPLINKKVSQVEINDLQIEINESWGMAARGNYELSEDIFNQMIKNEKGYNQ